jgi:hypothetical protein
MNGTIQITAAQLIIAVVSAAGIGALVSTGISELGKWRERKARHKELLLFTAVELAYKEREMMLKALQDSGQKGSLFPTIVTARWYHRQLANLFETGRISEDMERTFSDFINKSHTELDEEHKKKATAAATDTPEQTPTIRW